MALFEQIVGLALLLSFVWLGWRRWIEPYREGLDSQGIGLLMLAVLAIAGGFIGSPFWWIDDPDSFSWALPPLAARLLGAAAFAFGVVGCYALEQRQQRLVRSYTVMIAVYLAPLVGAILLLHLNRFDWHAPITYAFFLVAGGMSLAALWHLARSTTLGESFRDASAGSIRAIVQMWLWLVAAVAGLWGLAMFVYPQGPLRLIWVWPQDPLTSRLIATMLLTICAAAILGLRSAAQARMSLWLFVVYGIGAAVACFWNLVAGLAVPAAYAGAFCALTVVSIALLMTQFSKAEIAPA
jgi:hypothetical protein